MKRSEMMDVLMGKAVDGGPLRLAADSAGRILEVLDQAGITWEPEAAPEWPGLVPILQGGFSGYLMGRSGMGGGMFFPRPEADRIARAWNARRPGGPVEEEFVKVAKGLCALGWDGWRARLEAAMRLGVEDEK